MKDRFGIVQGGLSDEVYYSEQCQRYAKNSVIAGYFGCGERTDSLDAIVEIRLRTKGLSPQQIAVWMSSADGRHMMDSFEPGDDYDWMDSWIKSALENVKAIEKELSRQHSLSVPGILVTVRLQKEEIGWLNYALQSQASWFLPEPWKQIIRRILENIVAKASTS